MSQITDKMTFAEYLAYRCALLAKDGATPELVAIAPDATAISIGANVRVHRNERLKGGAFEIGYRRYGVDDLTDKPCFHYYVMEGVFISKR